MKRTTPLPRGSVLRRSPAPSLSVPVMRDCKVCRQPFQVFRSLQKICDGHECATVMVERAQAKAARVAARVDAELTRAKKEAIKGRQQWLKEAEAAVNRYVRLRDFHLGCVSCDKPATWDGRWNASHFRSVGAASAVRFHLWNIHKACVQCNKWKSGNLSEYEPRLRALIGGAKVDWLRTQNHLADYGIDYLKRLKRVFNRKANRQAKRIEASLPATL